MAITYWIIEILATTVEGYLGINIIETFGTKKFYGNKQLLAGISFACIYAAVITLLNYIHLFSWATVVSALLLLTLGGMLLSTTKFRVAFLSAAFYLVLISIIETFLVTVVSLGNGLTANQLIFKQGFIRCIYLITDKVIDCCLYRIFLYYMSKKGNYKSSIYQKQFIILAALGALLFVAFMQLTCLHIDTDIQEVIGSCGVVLFIAAFIFLRYLDMNKIYNSEQLVNFKLREEAEQIQGKYLDLYRNYQESSRNFQSFTNNLLEIDSLISRNQIQTAREYIQTTVKSFSNTAQQVCTGVEIVDAVLNEKIKEAWSEHITIQCQVDFPRNSCVCSTDLCSILVGLLDMAIEACRDIPAKKGKMVSVKIRPRNDFLIFRITNLTTLSPFLGSHLLKSVNQNSLQGRKIQLLAEKYGGKFFHTFNQEGQFVSIVMLNYKEITYASPDFRKMHKGIDT